MLLKNSKFVVTILLIALLASVIISLCVGSLMINARSLQSILMDVVAPTHPAEHLPQEAAVFWNIRLPRVVLGILVGSALAVSGAAMQGLFRNPLADPGLIGISAGAMLFAVITIVLEIFLLQWLKAMFGYYALSMAAFVGACLVTFLVYRLSVKNGKADITTLLLAGIAINALAGAFTGFLTYLSTEEQLRSITFWSMGSLGGASWKTVMAMLPFALIPLIVLPFLSKQLNGLALGESQALHMGIRVSRLKKLIIILTTMAVGASVAVAGIIGFIGLVIPHIIRIACSADNRIVIPASSLLGAIVLVLADTMARTIVSPAELPIGILTAIIGTPAFIFILLKQRRQRFM